MAKPKFEIGDVVQLDPIIFKHSSGNRGHGRLISVRGRTVRVKWIKEDWDGWSSSRHLELVKPPLSLEEMLRECLE
jgi:hypothetical protein